mmetsp:Transcript_78011/g.253111  ORF Transcript_78011/g.253111 Transcript_78011/m.253111 type:complete len:231 (+) Transcript_78011:971-1663(+)
MGLRRAQVGQRLRTQRRLCAVHIRRSAGRHGAGTNRPAPPERPVLRLRAHATSVTSAHRCQRRALHRRGAARAWLLQGGGEDRGEIRQEPIGRHKVVQVRRPRLLVAIGPTHVLGPQRRDGEDSGLSGRTDRGGGGLGSRGCSDRGSRLEQRQGRLVGLGDAGDNHAGAPEDRDPEDPPSVHGAQPHLHPRQAAAHAERQNRQEETACDGLRGGGQRRGQGRGRAPGAAT